MHVQNNQKRILLIDDEKDFLEIMSRKLTESGFSVFVADNGETGLEKAKVIKPDLILLDVQMPGIDGPTVLNRLKIDPATENIKVVFLTSYQEPEDPKSLALYIRKTDDLDIIVSTIRIHLDAQT